MNWILYVILPAVCIILGWTIRWLYARFQLSASEQRAERILQEAIKDAEAQKKEFLLEAKEQLIREQKQQERENRERRSDLQRFERRLAQKEEVLDKRVETVEKQEKELIKREAVLDERTEFLSGEEERYREELERISGLTQQQAKDLIIRDLETEAKHDAVTIINKIEQEAQLTAEKKAQDILITTIQRLGTGERHYCLNGQLAQR